MAAEVLEVHVECGSRRGWCCGWRWRCPWCRAWRGGSSSLMQGAGYGWAVAMAACRDPAAAVRSSGCSSVQGSGGGRAGIRLQWAETIRGGVQVATPRPSGKESRVTARRGLRSSRRRRYAPLAAVDRPIEWRRGNLKATLFAILYLILRSFVGWGSKVHEIGPGP
jgi:hypothetical protein